MDNHNQTKEEDQTRRCQACDRELRMGDDCLSVQMGVMGPRGFVPLDKQTFLCDYVCAEHHFSGGVKTVEKVSRRVP